MRYLLLALLLTACSKSSEVRHPPKVTGQFKSKIYAISDHEHVVAFDIPDEYSPTRCWVYSNEKAGDSKMQCGLDPSAETLPE